MSAPASKSDLLNDLDRPIWGAVEIARALGRSPRSVFHMLESGHLPARRVGRRWVTTRRQLLALVTAEGAGHARG